MNNTTTIIEKIKTTSQDWFNYIAQGLTSNVILKTDRYIDNLLLSESVLLTIPAEPVLGCT